MSPGIAPMKKPMNMRRRLVPTSIQNPAVPSSSHSLARMVDGAGKKRTSMNPRRAQASQSKSNTKGETIHIGIQRLTHCSIERSREAAGDDVVLGMPVMVRMVIQPTSR